MDKKYLLIKLLDICNGVKPGKKSKDLPRDKKMHPSARKLLCILYIEQRLNQRRMAELMHMSAQAVSVIVVKLENRGYVAREQGEVNNENIVYLTEKGLEKAMEIDKQMEVYADNLFQNFSDEELEIFAIFIQKLQSNHLINEIKE
ncbi:MarR family winged helix-turn-helix transcriptional regulator [Tannockella kyphosi]|uniref:MarR family winged helix-turn-helix transcriptional regulator n=1 Tax=Tannockella kyphosi TaxID=2899121 RepID=UPI00201148D2|nr:MarR family transcriptional regulator [Tannockella kyphosi]